jgi:polyribonucleotide nucleotidyltransferase
MLHVSRLNGRKRIGNGFRFLSGTGFKHLGAHSISITLDDGTMPLLFSWGTVGHLAKGSVLCRHGDTVAHAVVCTSKKNECKDNFLQVVVDYKYRMYANGNIPMGVNRRDRLADEDILVSRIIDRSIRPLFPQGYMNDIQVYISYLIIRTLLYTMTHAV